MARRKQAYDRDNQLQTLTRYELFFERYQLTTQCSHLTTYSGISCRRMFDRISSKSNIKFLQEFHGRFSPVYLSVSHSSLVFNEFRSQKNGSKASLIARWRNGGMQRHQSIVRYRFLIGVGLTCHSLCESCSLKIIFRFTIQKL
jgi:hypothetical protein